ncbi:necrosis inducing protein (NPP1) [Streptomyces viridochromogenes]|uniref:Necrosis inducing protein (NPP1) n=1 Tax=Streptomyces viridochromogenes TaxID=1938 RepID=A0A0J8BTP2_STRVR|nr:NPP1 family protein [Streptomyces viridochromogenes]KMS68935.1 necrosis inducing protein (NPP1) [Streptomyces viridochromogenes]
MPKALKTKRKSRLAKAAVVAGSITALTAGLTGSANAAVLQPLPANATTFQQKYMPLFDYDTDGCLPAAAVDANGRLNGGLNNSGKITGGCRDGHLGRANTYAQSKCQHGWCAYVYALYFEKDQVVNGADAFGHRHDFESVVALQKQGEERPRYLAASAHGKYSTHPINEVPMEGNHVKIVYHKDGGSSHAFRFAKWGEVPHAWGNGRWDQPALVSMERMAKAPRDALWNSKWGDANFPLTNNLVNEINKARQAKRGGQSIERIVPAFS